VKERRKLISETEARREIQANVKLSITAGIQQVRRGSNALLPHITVVHMVSMFTPELLMPLMQYSLICQSIILTAPEKYLKYPKYTHCTWKLMTLIFHELGRISSKGAL
jgi:hypothetical protein